VTTRGRFAGHSQLAGLLWTLVRTDFKTRYHGTLGGFVWALLKPLAMFVVLLGVFSFVFTAEPTYRLNLIVGLFLFDFFAEATKAGFVSLAAKGFLLAKVVFPSWIVVIGSTANAFITVLVFTLILAVALLVTGRMPAPAHWLLYAWYLLHFLAIAIGMSLSASVILLRYRDLNQVWEVVIQAGFFLAPIVYPIGVIPERFHKFLFVWPPTPIIQFARAVLVDGTVPSARAHLLLSASTLAVLGVGVLTYRRYARRSAEYL
jgi:ABC-type polysaccharide/polyol phosphate export permease